jgi:tRNA threonylcarbamoyladenosine biosynthesis protein TsaB
MTVLGINTSTEITEIALIKGNVTLYKESWEANHDEADRLLPAIKKIINLEKIDEVFVVKGPGGFTGLRIGVTAANTIGLIKNASIKSLDTFEFFFERLNGVKQEKTAVIIRAGGKNSALKFYGSKSEEPMQIPLEKLAQILKKEGVEAVLSLSKDIDEHVADFRQVQYQSILPFDDFLKKRLMRELPKSKISKPIYLNPPQITESKKKNFAK